MNIQQEEFLSVKQTAKAFNVTTNHVYHLIRTGVLKHVRLGGIIRVKRSTLNSLPEHVGQK
jgi:excisionase family DNA binding protein